eukprot:CAMPEP_0174737512 /NCGR_PEP_ID=MMETSP1094-20130205/68413_1 /TAXON_ID=156173 /ORGANISM="Chrysochromulina brevifilum, Strain UTEX LB 985" /LENGTH=120 /DNA_ID=CAMNT_0015940749 /DNA_START=72 /DNA_END=434 /DNA_ORIENTATION=+
MTLTGHALTPACVGAHHWCPQAPKTPEARASLDACYVADEAAVATSGGGVGAAGAAGATAGDATSYPVLIPPCSSILRVVLSVRFFSRAASAAAGEGTACREAAPMVPRAPPSSSDSTAS